MDPAGIVDALDRARHALTPSGVLLDVRPIVARAWVELLHAGDTRVLGHVRNATRLPKRRAVDAAIRTVLQRGWFRRERRLRFDFCNYFDSPAALREHVRSSQWSAAWITGGGSRWLSACQATGPHARLRIRDRIQATRLRRGERCVIH